MPDAAPDEPTAATPATRAASATAVAEAANPEVAAPPAELARLLGLSERTLYRRLGELAGLTPAAWLREQRLHQARELLETGDSDTVAAVGFVSA